MSLSVNRSIRRPITSFPVEVVEKVRPSVTREGTPLQIMDRAGIDRLGVQDLSEAVKRFSGVTVQDYGGSED